MRRGRILNPALAEALALVGHSDIVMVTDAGFPIPAGANRIDLAFWEGLPDVRDILRVLTNEMFFEEAHFATEVRDCHPALYADVQTIFTGSGCLFKGTTHEILCDDFAHRAKVIIRSGSFEPWANFALVGATEPFAWFTPESNVAPLPTYVARRAAILGKEVPSLD